MNGGTEIVRAVLSSFGEFCFRVRLYLPLVEAAATGKSGFILKHVPFQNQVNGETTAKKAIGPSITGKIQWLFLNSNCNGEGRIMRCTA